MESIDEDISIESVLVMVLSKFLCHFLIQDYSRELSHVVWFIFKMVYNNYYTSSGNIKKYVIIHLIISMVHLAYDIYVYLVLPNDNQLQHILIHLPSIMHDLNILFKKENINKQD